MSANLSHVKIVHKFADVITLMAVTSQ